MFSMIPGCKGNILFWNMLGLGQTFSINLDNYGKYVAEVLKWGNVGTDFDETWLSILCVRDWKIFVEKYLTKKMK